MIQINFACYSIEELNKSEILYVLINFMLYNFMLKKNLFIYKQARIEKLTLFDY